MGNSLYKSIVFAPPNPALYTLDENSDIIEILTRSNKTIHAQYLPTKKKARNTLVYSHGNATDIGGMIDTMKFLRNSLNVNVLHYEYLGYGLNTYIGYPSEVGCYESIDATIQYLLDEKHLQLSDIIIYGMSLGSGPSCYIVNKYKKIKGLILECPFTSCISIVAPTIGKLINNMDTFPNVENIKTIDCSVYIMHGTDDSIVNVSHATELWNNIPKESQYRCDIVEGADHHNIVDCMGVDTYIKNLIKFIEYCNFNLVLRKNRRFPNIVYQKKRRCGLFSCYSLSENKDNLLDNDVLLNNIERLDDEFNDDLFDNV